LNSRGHAWPGGSLLPNDLGLFDMLGNVDEWCQDRNEASLPSERGGDRDTIISAEVVTDQFGRMLRGGSFSSQPRDGGAASRGTERPSVQGMFWGFRPARTLRPSP